jgi:hypothetical protein
MRSKLFREGGPYKIRQTGRDNYSMTIPLPTGADGRIARECPSPNCSPGYFKVKSGTGIVDGQTVAYCPYCRGAEAPNNFATKGQVEYAKQVMMREAHEGIGNMIRECLDIGSTGRRTIGGGLLKIELSMKQGSRPSVRRPFEEGLQRAILCPSCGLDHAVFGLAVWCPDCGSDVFVSHVRAEIEVVKTMLRDIPRRQEELGPRIAARDLENCLEDVVSIYEAVLRALFVRNLRTRGLAEQEIHSSLARRVANRFQNVRLAAEIISRELDMALYDGMADDEIQQLSATFEKRHPITHNLGVVDRKYLERMCTVEKEGAEIFVTAAEIEWAIEAAMRVIVSLHSRLFPPPVKPDAQPTCER